MKIERNHMKVVSSKISTTKLCPNLQHVNYELTNKTSITKLCFNSQQENYGLVKNQPQYLFEFVACKLWMNKKYVSIKHTTRYIIMAKAIVPSSTTNRTQLNKISQNQYIPNDYFSDSLQCMYRPPRNVNNNLKITQMRHLVSKQK